MRWLYISKGAKVYKVPHPKNLKFKAVKELAGQEVLQVMLYYETKDKEPYKLMLTQFDRIILDSEGIYEHNDEDRDRAMYNYLNFAFTTPDDLAKRDDPLTIPLAPVIPLKIEKEALYEYLTQKVPSLAEDAPLIVEGTIKSLQKSHEEKNNLIRDAQKLKR